MIEIKFVSSSEDTLHDSQKKICMSLVSTNAYIDSQIVITEDIVLDDNRFSCSMLIGSETTEDIRLEVDLDIIPIQKL